MKGFFLRLLPGLPLWLFLGVSLLSETAWAKQICIFDYDLISV